MSGRSNAGVATQKRSSWLPMAAIAMGQAQMSWNINALPVSIGGISAEFIPTIPPGFISKVDLDNVTFVSNDRLLAMMSRTTAIPEQVDAALQINADARLRGHRPDDVPS